MTQRDMINSSSNLKAKSALEFLQNVDKMRTGLTPYQNFLKVSRIFGLQLNQAQVPQNDNGQV